jgi:hypothetical protein
MGNRRTEVGSQRPETGKNDLKTEIGPKEIEIKR